MASSQSRSPLTNLSTDEVDRLGTRPSRMSLRTRWPAIWRRRSNADNLVYVTEKSLQDLGDKW